MSAPGDRESAAGPSGPVKHGDHGADAPWSMIRAEQTPLAATTLDAALRSLRYPATALAAVLAETASRLGADVLAAYLVPADGGTVHLLGSVGPAATDDLESMAPGELDRLLGKPDGSVVDMPPLAPEPWRRFAVLGRTEAALPDGARLRMLAATDGEFDGEDLRASTGPVAALAAIVHVARESELLREELHRLRQDRTLMAASLQHDLRTPLTSILGSARTLDRQWAKLPPMEREELLGMIASQAERLSGMVAEALGREVGSPDAPLRAQRADVGLLARRVVAAGRAARGGSVDIQVDPAVIVTDPDRLERALLNLLDNALKYSPPDATVHLAGEAARDRYTFTVADAGPGVDSEILPSLFAAFATDRSRPGGTGLGLHSVVRLAGELGGNVSYSRRGGVTRFCLTVPDSGGGTPPDVVVTGVAHDVEVRREAG